VFAELVARGAEPDAPPTTRSWGQRTAYLRDPDIALDALASVLRGATVLGFTLERFVNDVNGVWQEVVVCDGTRLVLWHGEDVPPEDGPPGAMTSSSRSQQFDIAVMALMAAPVLLFIWVYAGYALVTWRRRPGDGSPAGMAKARGRQTSC